MQIVGGQFRNRKLVTPKGDSTRPTSGMLRETLFNICQQSIIDARFLDLCAGSGAVGLEALSRGAKEATFVENNREALKCIHQNIATLQVQGATHIIPAEALRALKQFAERKAQFDLIYVDPPYQTEEEISLAQQILLAIDQHQLLAANGTLFIEEAHANRHVLEETFLQNLILEKNRKSGKSILYQFIPAI